MTCWDWTLQPLKRGEDDVEGLVFCLLNVTQRVHARQRLVENERKYRELVQYANSIIMRVTPEHVITFFNEFGQSFLGYREDEVLGRCAIGTIIPHVDSEGRDMREFMAAVSANPERYASNESENVCKDGRRVWVHWSNRPLRDSGGNVTELLCVGTDITARREMEAERRRGQERLRALSERLALAEEEDRWRISRYIHDTIIQNLSLSNIQLGGMVGALMEAGHASEAETVRQVRRLVSDAVSECRMVMSDLTPALLYELGLIPALRDLARQLQDKHGATIVIDDDDSEMPMTRPLRGLVFQSIRELILNAVKHASSCTIRVRAERKDDTLLILVADSGKGFDVTVSAKRPDHEGGFGLLNIRQRVEGLGGQVSIESVPGEGTVATISVPLSVDADAPPG